MNKFEQLELKENIQHGNSLTPYEYYYCTIPESFINLMPHWHEEIEIGIIQSGSAIYNIGGELHPVKKGDLVFISPNTIHSVHDTEEHSMVSESIVFHCNLLGCQNPDSCTLHYFLPFMNGISTFTPVLRNADTGYAELFSCLSEITQCILHKEPLYEIRFKEKLFQLFFYLYHYKYILTTLSSPSSNRMEQKMKQVLFYIEQHYTEKIRIDTLADISGFSEIHFMNLFKKCMGSSCIDYINNYRLATAATLLKNTEEPIMNIAFDTGFYNVSYFNRQFKKKCGMTPSAFRDLHLFS